ncbi:radical SAM protein [Azoarcus sp. TTM-91]|uniref:radical SAM protein n=1 Tax=Azoarcus sp. TTM-91 TaxID=2691581 RepID=UPI001B7CD9D7|nr:radical SAM protein [Azoarcus sp. TTM-91]
MISPVRPLTIRNHDRDLAGLTYVYPVLSRRAGGVSIGINLNPNNACNWHCAYCQVPDLVRGKAPVIDLAQLEQELGGFLDDLVHGDWLQRHAPEGMRTIRDLAFSGNGEPTSAAVFPEAVELAVRLRERAGLGSEVPIRLITNGSLIAQEHVQQGVRALGEAGGEVWFKVDAGTAEAMARINGVRMEPAVVAKHLALSASLCPTWVQTCMFRWDGTPPSGRELAAYLDVLTAAGVDTLQGVLLYGLARPSMQVEASHLTALAAEELEALAARIREKGLTVRVSP